MGLQKMNKQSEMIAFRKNILPQYIEYVENNKKDLSLKGAPVKKCKLCGKIKRLSSFYKNPLKSMGVFDECKECIKQRAKIYRGG